MKCLTPTKLVILGHLLIQCVYNNLSSSIGLQKCIEKVIGDNNSFEETRDDLVAYLVWTYCHMRGKDFCRHIMATNFLNLGKGIRPTLAVLSDKNSYCKKHELFDKITTACANNNCDDM